LWGPTTNNRETNKVLQHTGKPLPEAMWILVDLANGNRGSHNYLWWFDTRKQALDFLSHHNKLYNHAQLAGPFKFKSASSPEPKKIKKSIKNIG